MRFMNLDIELKLPLILFLPWYLILGALFWAYPRRPLFRRSQLGA